MMKMMMAMMTDVMMTVMMQATGNRQAKHNRERLPQYGRGEATPQTQQCDEDDNEVDDDVDADDEDDNEVEEEDYRQLR